VLTVIRPEQCSVLTKALRKTKDMGVIWCRQRVADFASARYPRPQKSRPGAPGSFDRIKERLEINHFEPSLIGLVCKTRGRRYAMAISDVEIMAAFSSEVQDLLHQG